MHDKPGGGREIDAVVEKGFPTVVSVLMKRDQFEAAYGARIAWEATAAEAACSVLGLSSEVTERLVNGNDWRATTAPARQFKATKHWGAEEVIHVQIMKHAL